MYKKMKGAFALSAAVIAISMALVGRAQAPPDPESALKEISTWYADQVKQARDKKTQIDFTKLLAERRAKAEAALKDVDPAKAEPAKCLALAQLYQIVEKEKEALAAAERFLTSNPEATPKYTAQQIVLAGYQTQGDADGLIRVLDQMKPPAPQLSAFLASSVARQYAVTVAEKKGLQAGLDLLKRMEARVPFDQLKTPQEKNIGSSAIASIAMGRSSLYEKAGKTAEAKAALEEAVKQLGAGNVYARQIESKLKLASIPGSPAPELKFDRHYGDFKDLASLKGKVVVLDFTAHW